MTDSIYIQNETCKFPEESEVIAGLTKDFPSGSRVSFKMRKMYPHPHTLSNLKKLTRMPIDMRKCF